MMKRNIRHFLTGIFLSFLASGCESDFDGNITGTYSNQTDTSMSKLQVKDIVFPVSSMTTGKAT